jgi:hypothetical protein
MIPIINLSIGRNKEIKLPFSAGAEKKARGLGERLAPLLGEKISFIL